ncbi:hypothetical protein BD779DRAFT_1547571, partial [Infundibulicybe gibba]
VLVEGPQDTFQDPYFIGVAVSNGFYGVLEALLFFAECFDTGGDHAGVLLRRWSPAYTTDPIIYYAVPEATIIAAAIRFRPGR